MRVLVVGGTGTAGRPAVEELVRRGHAVRVVSRGGHGVAGADGVRADLTTGAGLAEAMDAVDAVVDTSNITTLNREKATAFFVGATERLVAAEAAAGVRHHVLLSIVGIDLVPSGYYQAKLAQERALAQAADAAGIRWSVLRATQFHDFAAQMLTRFRLGPVAAVPVASLQPVSTLDVARALADAVESGPGPSGRLPDLAGPEVLTLPAMARALLHAREERVVVVPLPLPGATGTGMRAGLLRPAAGTPVRIGDARFEDYLRGSAAAGRAPRADADRG